MSARHQDDDIPGARGAHARGEILVVGAWRDKDGVASLCGVGRTRKCLEGRVKAAAVIGIAAILGAHMPDHRAED